jgi:hypothetical protein
MADGQDHGGGFESDEFSPNIPQLGRKFRGPRFNQHREADDHQMRDPFAKNPGVNAAISDPPPDMRIKPPMKGEVDKRAQGRTATTLNYVPGWEKPKGKSAAKTGNRYANDDRLSSGDFLKSKAPWY